LGIDSQLAQNWALEVDYIGTKANHLDDLRYFNQPEPGVGALQPRRPYPDFNMSNFFTSDNNSFYSALQVKLTKKFSSGFTFLISYTFANDMADGAGNEYGGVNADFPQDDNNREANWGPSATASRQRFVFSPIWRLPVGNGKRWLNRSGVVNGFLGGWEISGIWTIQSGFPFPVTSTGDYSNTGSVSPRPDRTCSGVGQKTVSSWFDASCFTTTALVLALASGQPRFGNSGRNILDVPGRNNIDLALMKDFRMGERFKLQFRAESFNIFNQAHFGYPVPIVGDPNIGQIGSASDGRDTQFGLKLQF
jgi:hypothetical protein